ncbi:MAG: hypothetical protein QME76_12350 [Bacillota bacterium]|nr:hypothetical protein [Bacillota bacterium]
MRKRLLGVALIVLAVLGGCGGAPPNGATTAPQVDWPTADVTSENVKAAIGGLDDPGHAVKVKGHLVSVDVTDHAGTDDPGDKIVTVVIDPGEVWDETHFLKIAGGSATAAMEVLFKNPKVQRVVFEAQTTMVDQYGKSNKETGARIMLERATADKIDWKGFKDKQLVAYTSIYDIADDWDVHPGILAKAKPPK